MNRNLIIKIQKEIRARKDALRESVFSGIHLAETTEKIIFPQNVYIPRDYNNIDQWYFSGFLIQLEKQLIVVDPGVDFYSRFTTTKYSFSDITAIICTHSHIDHASSLPIFLEKILRYKNNNFKLFITQDTLDTKIPEYIKDQLKKEENAAKLFILKDENKKIIVNSLGEYSIEFLPLFHSCPDTFGFKVIKEKTPIAGYVSDTGYSKEVKTSTGIEMPESVEGEFLEIANKHEYIKSFFTDCKNLVININDLQYNRHTKYHLCAWDVLDMCEGSMVKKIILQHLSSINADGEDSNYLYKLFFHGEQYEAVLPTYTEKTINI